MKNNIKEVLKLVEKKLPSLQGEFEDFEFYFNGHQAVVWTETIGVLIKYKIGLSEGAVLTVVDDLENLYGERSEDWDKIRSNMTNDDSRDLIEFLQASYDDAIYHAVFDGPLLTFNR